MKLLTQKKLFLLMAISTMLFIGCKETSKEATIEEAVVSELSDAGFTALWGKVVVLWEQRDVSLISTVYADNFMRISPHGTSTSVEELTTEMNTIAAAYPDLKLNLVRYDIRGNMAVVHWTVEGTFTGELAGIKGNGNPFKDITGVTVITVEDGRIVKDDSYWDTFAMFGQTGYGVIEIEVEEE